MRCIGSVIVAAGAPVVTSNVSSLPEVVGDAAVLEYTRRFDRVEAGSVRELELTGEQYSSLKEAVQRFHGDGAGPMLDGARGVEEGEGDGDSEEEGEGK